MEFKPTVDERFPRTFEGLMSVWRKKVPHNGRIIDGCYELLYRSDCIAIGCVEGSEAAKKLRYSETKLRDIFYKLVGYTGGVIIKVFESEDKLYDAIADAVRRVEEKKIREDATVKAAIEIFNIRQDEVRVTILDRIFS